MDLRKILLLVIALVTVEAAMELPPYVSKCPLEPKALSECATKQAPRVLAALAKGDRKYNIPPIDPFSVELMQVDQPGITIKFTKMQFLGFTKGIITHISIDESKKIFGVDYIMPQVTTIAHCAMDANLRVIRIRGEGESRMDIFNVTGHWKASWTRDKHADGLEYMKLLNASVDIEPTKMVFNFDNLINNDATLGEAVNNLLNENWRDIFVEVKSSVEEALAEMMKVALDGVTSHVPIQNMFS